MSSLWVQNLKTSRIIHVQTGLKKWFKLRPLTLLTENPIRIFFNLHRPLNCCMEKQVDTYFWVPVTCFLFSVSSFPYFFFFYLCPLSFLCVVFSLICPSVLLTSVYLFVYKSVWVFVCLSVCLFVCWLIYSLHSFLPSFLCCCLFWLKIQFTRSMQSCDVFWTAVKILFWNLTVDFYRYLSGRSKLNCTVKKTWLRPWGLSGNLMFLFLPIKWSKP